MKGRGKGNKKLKIMDLDNSGIDELVDVPERIGYYALMLSILKDYSAAKALRYMDLIQNRW